MTFAEVAWSAGLRVPAGWGNWANTLVILILMAMVGATATVDSHQAEVVWRTQARTGENWA